jgi:hypothetical protein
MYMTARALYSLIYFLFKFLKKHSGGGPGRSGLDRDFVYRDHADHEGPCWTIHGPHRLCRVHREQIGKPCENYERTRRDQLGI